MPVLTIKTRDLLTAREGDAFSDLPPRDILIGLITLGVLVGIIILGVLVMFTVHCCSKRQAARTAGIQANKDAERSKGIAHAHAHHASAAAAGPPAPGRDLEAQDGGFEPRDSFDFVDVDLSD